MEILTVTAVKENLDQVQRFVNRQIEAHRCSKKASANISLAIEEVFINIAQYAYSPEIGDVTISCNLQGCPLKLTVIFEDRGIPWNPLVREDVGIKSYVKNRKPGGLGIFLVKKIMDTAVYKFDDGKNILILTKKLVD